ncbi:uncharacterized protein [Nicotiana tomentosiformis]|uniref:uncharacterized protein n=1 Tax=Nicotiana tomentosiformis TaxID=4098 RepID=UPI00051B580C|nr:uncharacterized protein LOC104088545 [Nicotiana tomentosiformis]
MEPLSTSGGSSVLPSTQPPPPPPNPAAKEKKAYLKMKKKVLLKIKAQYEKEIAQYERESKSLNEMKAEAEIEIERRNLHQSTTVPFDPLAQSLDSTSGRLVDGLLAQAEAQEAVIRKVSNLCDVAEAYCTLEEERMKQSFFDLPVWAGPPRELVTFLCVEENSGQE